MQLVSSASEPCYSTHCTLGTIGISDKCQWNHKNFRADKDSNPDLLLEKCLSSPHLRDHLFENKNIWQKYTDEKRNMTPLYWRNNLSCIFKYAAKNNNTVLKIKVLKFSVSDRIKVICPEFMNQVVCAFWKKWSLFFCHQVLKCLTLLIHHEQCVSCNQCFVTG